MTRTNHVIHHRTGTRIEAWMGDLTGSAPERPPDAMFLSSRDVPGLVWVQERKAGGERVFRPGRAACLALLMKEVRRDGEVAVRRRYSIPITINLALPWQVLGEHGIGANIPDLTELARLKGVPPSVRLATTIGPNFLVNDLPSGFGYPPLMFDLRVFSSEARRVDGGTFRKEGQEAVAGVRCDRYFAEDGQTRCILWVEPRSELVLRADTTVKPRHFPGTRQPPTQAYTRGYEVVRYRTLPTPPSQQTFVLPAGATVELPRLLWNLPLPRGVKRRKMMGIEAEVGFPFRPFTSGRTQVIGSTR